MSTLPKTLTLDTSTSRANPTPQPMKRLTVPRIRQRKGGEPIVMLTARTELLDIHNGLALGADGYITKPYSKTQLAEVISHVLKHTA